MRLGLKKLFSYDCLCLKDPTVKTYPKKVFSYIHSYITTFLHYNFLARIQLKLIEQAVHL